MNPIIPDWPAPACVRAFSTLRSGGLSMAPYHGREKKDGGLNLGLHVGDDARIVLENRARLRRFLPSEPVWLNQVHGNRVVDASLAGDVPDADASFFVKSEKQMRKIYLRDILFVEALENYVSIYTTSGRVLTHSTLKRIGESLPDDQFLQTHKSYIINADRVDLVEGNRLRIESYQIPIARNLRDVVFKRILKNTL